MGNHQRWAAGAVPSLPPEVSGRGAPRAPSESGEFPKVPGPLRRRSVDNLVAVRPVAPAPAKAPAPPLRAFDLDDPFAGPALELDRESPASGRGSQPEIARTRFVDADDFDAPEASVLELSTELRRQSQVWSASRPPPSRSSGQGPASHRAIPPPPPSGAVVAAAVPSSDTRSVLAAFAGFGDPPRSILGTPGYALHVLMRRRVLAHELELARRHRPSDVALYEQALRCADASAVRAGVTLSVAFAVGVAVLAKAAAMLLSDGVPLP